MQCRNAHASDAPPGRTRKGAADRTSPHLEARTVTAKTAIFRSEATRMPHQARSLSGSQRRHSSHAASRALSSRALTDRRYATNSTTRTTHSSRQLRSRLSYQIQAHLRDAELSNTFSGEHGPIRSKAPAYVPAGGKAGRPVTPPEIRRAKQVIPAWDSSRVTGRSIESSEWAHTTDEFMLSPGNTKSTKRKTYQGHSNAAASYIIPAWKSARSTSRTGLSGRGAKDSAAPAEMVPILMHEANAVSPGQRKHSGAVGGYWQQHRR